MGDGIGEVLPFAVAIAISPIPIIAIILMLFSQRARVNGPAFLVGWAGGLTLLSTVVYLAAGAAGAGTDDGPSTAVGWVKVALGLLLLVLAGRSIRASRDADGEEPMPKWMAGIDDIAPGRALVLGAVLSSINPKNLVLAFGAIVGLAQLGLPTEEAVGSIAVFVVVASLSIAGAVTYQRLGGDRAQRQLSTLQAWMERHNSAVMAVLLVIIGAVLISQGLTTLA